MEQIQLNTVEDVTALVLMCDKHFPMLIQCDETNTVLKAIKLIDMMVELGLAESKTKARALIEQKGVSIEGNKIDLDTMIQINTNSFIIRVGKLNFKRVIL